MTLDELLERLDGVRNGKALCPAHDDHQASLSVGESDEGKILLHCHAGCSPRDVCEALGLPMTALFPEQEERVYTYRDREGRSLYDKIRKPGKEFVFRRYIGDATEWGLGDTQRVLYRLPEVLSADPVRWVFITEGEKDADAIWEAGGVATTYGGVNDWQKEFADYLIGRNVTVIQDKDDAGRKAATQILLDLNKKVKNLRLVEARQGKDASDHLTAGYDLEQWVEPTHFRPIDFTNPAPVVKWLLPNWVAKGDLVLLSALAGLGKSYWTMGLATVMANNLGLFLRLPVEGGKVLYFDEENPEDVVHRRLNQLGHKNYSNLRYIWANGLRMDTHPERLIQEALLFQPKLIVIDSLARIHSKDENSFSEMSTILNDTLKPLARDTGAGVIVIHHHDKSGRGARGSGDIEAACDTVIDLFGRPGSGEFFQKMKKSRRSVSGEGIRVTINNSGLEAV